MHHDRPTGSLSAHLAITDVIAAHDADAVAVAMRKRLASVLAATQE